MQENNNSNTLDTILEDRLCPVGYEHPNCMSCDYQKEGFCDYPYLGAEIVYWKDR